MAKVIVTGASGFIGGQTALELHDSGHEVVGIDIVNPSKSLSTAFSHFINDDFAGNEALEWIYKSDTDAIIHCAGTSLVGPSVTNPAVYYENNFVKTKHFVEHIITTQRPIRFIFSSSSSVYGEPVMIPCREEDPPLPLSPYGESKYMIEMMLNAYAQAYNLNVVMLRYFNVCGADPQARHGQKSGATHIVARVLESLKDEKPFTLFGNDYPTTDGTCVRDQVHVQDVARLHLQAIKPEFVPAIYNVCATGGSSNREIIEAAERITGRKLDLQERARRAGDPSRLIGSADRLRQQGWEPQHNLDAMIQHAWNWYNNGL